MTSSFNFTKTGSFESHEAARLGDICEPGSSFATLFDADASTWWLGCLNPSNEEVDALGSALGLHSLTMDDILTQESTQKLEKFGSYYFIVFTAPEQTYLSAIVTATGVVTICYSCTNDHVVERSSVLGRLNQIKDLHNGVVSSDWIICTILDQITDNLSAKVQEVENEVAITEENIFRNINDAEIPVILQRMAVTREKTSSLVNLLQGKRAVVHALAYHAKANTKQDTSDWDLIILLGSIEGHLAETADRLDALENMLSRSYINLISAMRVRVVHSNSSMEGVVAIVTLFSVSMLPSHIISSIWAMNCAVPGQHAKAHNWFWSVIASMSGATALCGIASVWYYKKILKGGAADRVMSAPSHPRDLST